MRPHVDDRECRKVCDLLEMWVDGELSAADATRVQIHLDNCAECRSELLAAEQIASGLRSLPTLGLPDNLVRAVRGRTRTGLRIRFGDVFARLAARPLPALAAVAAVVMAVAVLAPWRGPSRPRYSDQEVARATAETKLALAYVASATQQAERGVKRRILGDGASGRTLRGLQNAIRAAGGAETATEDAPPVLPQRTTVQGS